MIRSLFLLLSVSTCFTFAQYCSNYTNCDTYECHEPNYNTDFLVWLEQEGPGFKQFHSSMQQAVDIMKSFGGTVSDDIDILHMTLQYYCCYNLTQYEQIINVIESIQWEPFELTFSHAICNLGGDSVASDTSIITLLDEKGQKQMEAFVASIEQALQDAGIPIHIPRSQQEPFHSTIGVVNATVSAAQVVQEINSKITVWNQTPMRIDYFFMLTPPHVFHAINTTRTYKPVQHNKPINADSE